MARDRQADVRPAREGALAVLVLGCEPVRSADGWLVGALGRRVAAGREAYMASPGAFILVTGGRTWQGVVEADAMRDALVRGGVDEAHVVRERCALSTRDNARHAADLLRRFAHEGPVLLVTCDWHVPRARALFAREGLVVEAVPVPGPEVSATRRLFRAVHEWVSLRVPAGVTP